MDERRSKVNSIQKVIKMIPVDNSQSKRNNRTSDSLPSKSKDSYISKLQTRCVTDTLSTKGSDSDNIVTAATTSTARNSSSSSECQYTSRTTTNTTSSGSGGDDYDQGTLCKPEKKDQDGNWIGNSTGNRNQNSLTSRSLNEHNKDTVLFKTAKDIFPPRKKVRHHQQDDHHQRPWNYTASIKSHSPSDDGFTLQVPGDDGSDLNVAGDIEGAVPIKPATVVASLLFTPGTTATDAGLSSTSAKRRSSSETSTKNQHHLLLTPHREPRYHTIRNTLYRFQSSDSNSNGNSHSHRSNTEDGYAGSVSSNESGSANQQLGSSSPSPSETSSEEYEQQGRLHKVKRHRLPNKSKQKSSQVRQEGDDPESSSEIADFGSSGTSGSSETMDEDDVGNEQGGDTQVFRIKEYASSSSPSLVSSNYSDSGGLEMAYLSAKRDADAEHERMLKMESKASTTRAKSLASHVTSSKRLASKNLEDGRPPILVMGCDVMAHILTFLHPPQILDVLTMPLSKCWLRSFASQPELWRVLCLVEPFKATMDDKRNIGKGRAGSLGDGSCCSVKAGMNADKLLDKYRLLYTSFVRCMKYVSQIRDDAINGRPPAYIDYGISGGVSTPDMQYLANSNKATNRGLSGPRPPTNVGSNRNLQLFLAEARNVVSNSSNSNAGSTLGGGKANPRNFAKLPSFITAARVGTAHRKDERKNTNQVKKKGPKLGRSMITSRLLTPVEGSEKPSNLNLPWSCAIYSIVNWMVAFSDVEGLQTLCLKALPVLLENEQHRLTAQHAGLADVVLRAMVMFSESAQLHIAAFHTIVLLARPHGGSEGMMFRSSMTADGIFRGIYQRHGKSGIAVMLDSMRRFQDNATLLAMSCWALVNIALVSDQKAVLVKLGGIQAITNAMYRHPFSAELQFRALFALINLVIPSVQNLDSNGSNNNDGNQNNNDSTDVAASRSSEPEQLGELNETTEKEIIDELVADVASLVVHVMKNFCSSEAILNRACLVLHNLSLTDDYHVILLWTPQCYQMLEWCVANFRSDQVLQQSATGTLHRLQSTLASDGELRARFSKSLQTQQKHVTLKRTRQEV